MKKCGHCERENDDLMSFCVECGTALTTQPIGEPATVNLPTTPTIMGAGRETETVVANRAQPQQQAFQPQKKSNVGKILLIVFGAAAVLGLLVVGVAAIILFATMPSDQGNKISPLKSTPAPTRGIDSPPPTPQASFTPPIEPTKKGSFTIYANTGWQLSDIDTVSQEQFRTVVSGKIDLNGIKTGVGPGGVNDAKTKSRRLFPEFPTGALLMRTRYADGRFSNVAALAANGANGNWQNYKDETGKIEFCLNDNAPENNGGQFTVTVTFTSAPKPKK